ncbi:MAG: hypothetical protein M5R42_16985 [Rhodocyclaceae bacterium]|nr:hypothetical protein [Rhodocyclaceae bacterium]
MASPDKARLEWIFGFFPALKKFWNQAAGTLSGGQEADARHRPRHRRAEKASAGGRADQGLAPAIIQSLIVAFRELKAMETTIPARRAELQFRQALGDTVAVMDDGRIVHGGTDGRTGRGHGSAAEAAGPFNGYPSMTTTVTPAPAEGELPRLRLDVAPLLVLPILALLALPLVGSFPTWVTLTIAGLAMGMMIFIMASGLTLVFGLMDVLNFGHGAFVSISAFVAHRGAAADAALDAGRSVWLNLAALAGWPGWRCSSPARSAGHLRSAHRQAGLPQPGTSNGSSSPWAASSSPSRLIHVVLGPRRDPLSVASRSRLFRGDRRRGHRNTAARRRRRRARSSSPAMLLVLNRTRIGLLMRAGVENGEMVEALGYRIRRLFVGVFIASPPWQGWAACCGASTGNDHRPHGLRPHGAGVHRDHRRAGLGGRLLHRLRCWCRWSTHRLPRAEDRFSALQHPAHGGHSAVAAQDLLCGGRSDDSRPDCSRAISRAAARSPSPSPSLWPVWRWRPSSFPGARALNVAATICVFIVLVASLRPAARLHRHHLLRPPPFLTASAPTVGLSSTAWGRLGRRVHGADYRPDAVAGTGAGDRRLFSLRVKAIFNAAIRLAGGLGLRHSRPHSFPTSPAARVKPHLQRALGAFAPASVSSGGDVPAPPSTASSSPTTWCSSRPGAVPLAPACGEPPSAACCRRSARTTSAPRRSATHGGFYRTLANCLSGGDGDLAGALMALAALSTGRRRRSPLHPMMDILLIVVIGGAGHHLYGAAVSSKPSFILKADYRGLMPGQRWPRGPCRCWPICSIHDRWLL